MMQHAQPIIIIKKRRHAKHGHHGGAWKVAYADFVTAMMAFFLVMWLVNTSPQVSSNLASYFRDPGLFELTSGGGAMPGASMGATAGNAQMPPVAARESRARDHRRQHPRGARKRARFKEIKDRVEVTVTAEGLRIEMLDKDDRSFFDVGSSQVHPDLVEVLRTVAANIKDVPNKIAIEGHTDAGPTVLATESSNWELSSGRANSARRVLEESGLDATHLEALHGYGNSRLRYPDQPLDARNRRIAIVLLSTR